MGKAGAVQRATSTRSRPAALEGLKCAKGQRTSPLKTSGAMYTGVPTWLIVAVPERNFDSPKSASFAAACSTATPVGATSSAFSVLMSRSAARAGCAVGTQVA